MHQGAESTLPYPTAHDADGSAWTAAGHETVEGLDGAEVPLKVAKDDVEMIGRVGPLARNRQDMIDYLEWEIALGDKYETEAEAQ